MEKLFPVATAICFQDKYTKPSLGKSPYHQNERIIQSHSRLSSSHCIDHQSSMLWQLASLAISGISQHLHSASDIDQLEVKNREDQQVDLYLVLYCDSEISDRGKYSENRVFSELAHHYSSESHCLQDSSNDLVILAICLQVEGFLYGTYPFYCMCFILYPCY